MNHRARGVLTACLLSWAVPSSAASGRAVAAALPGAQGMDPAAAAAAQPAPFQQQRAAFVDVLEGWAGMARARGESFAELAAKIDGIRAEAAGLADADAPADAAKALAKDRKAFERWKRAFLDKLYGTRNGVRLADAGKAERKRFTGLAEAQADGFRELAHRPVVEEARLAEARGALAQAASPEQSGRFFDNELTRAGAAFGLDLSGVPVPAQLAAARIERAPARPAAPSFVRAAWLGSSGVRLADAATPAAFTTADIVVPSPAAAPAATGYAPPGSGSAHAKRSWQREILAATGAWSLLSAVGVDPERFIAALTGAESGYATTATSRTGAAGVMQLMPDTARAIMRGADYRSLAARYGLPVYPAARMSDAAIQRMLNQDWRTNILLGILYIKEQAGAFDDYVRNLGVSAGRKAQLMMNMVAGAYNAGPGRVFAAIGRLHRSGLSLAGIDPSQSLVRIRETQNYVRKILRDYGVSFI